MSEAKADGTTTGAKPVRAKKADLARQVESCNAALVKAVAERDKAIDQAREARIAAGNVANSLRELQMDYHGKLTRGEKYLDEQLGHAREKLAAAEKENAKLAQELSQAKTMDLLVRAGAKKLEADLDRVRQARGGAVSELIERTRERDGLRRLADSYWRERRAACHERDRARELAVVRLEQVERLKEENEALKAKAARTGPAPPVYCDAKVGDAPAGRWLTVRTNDYSSIVGFTAGGESRVLHATSMKGASEALAELKPKPAPDPAANIVETAAARVPYRPHTKGSLTAAWSTLCEAAVPPDRLRDLDLARP